MRSSASVSGLPPALLAKPHCGLIARRPDYQGHIRRLRTSDGVHFTKFGARKLALYVDREIERLSQKIPVALPVPADGGTAKGKHKGSKRPAAGPVVPLTGVQVGSERLLGGSERAAVVDSSVAAQVLSTGEGVAAPIGRADDFRWPRSILTEPTDRRQPERSSRPASAEQPELPAAD